MFSISLCAKVEAHTHYIRTHYVRSITGQHFENVDNQMPSAMYWRYTVAPEQSSVMVIAVRQAPE
jgi:hypothetical protein